MDNDRKISILIIYTVGTIGMVHDPDGGIFDIIFVICAAIFSGTLTF
jgi:hypothetical protein